MWPTFLCNILVVGVLTRYNTYRKQEYRYRNRWGVKKIGNVIIASVYVLYSVIMTRILFTSTLRKFDIH